MKVEHKINYTNGHRGSFWAEEANAIVNEILNTFKAWFTPDISRENQMVTGIDCMARSTYFHVSVVANVYTLMRKDGLPTTQYVEGITGSLINPHANRDDNPTMRFIGTEPIPMKLRGKDILMNQLIENELYFYVFLKDENDLLYANLFPVSITGAEVVNTSSGRIVTCKPTKIDADNSFIIPHVPNGDLVFKRCEVYMVDDYGNVMNEYDTFFAEMDASNPTRVLLNHDDGLTLEGRFGVVSYSY